MDSILATKIIALAMKNFQNIGYGAQGSFPLDLLSKDESDYMKDNVRQVKQSWNGIVSIENCHWRLLNTRNGAIVIVYFHDQKKGFPDLGNIVIDACELTKEALNFFKDNCKLQVNKTVGETIVKKTVAKTIVKKHSAKSYSDAAGAGATASAKNSDNKSNLFEMLSNAQTDEEKAAKEVEKLECQLVQARLNSEAVKIKSLEIKTTAKKELLKEFEKTKKMLKDLGIDPETEAEAEAELTSPTSVAMISSETQLDEN